jgi:hypothetical protein
MPYLYKGTKARELETILARLALGDGSGTRHFRQYRNTKKKKKKKKRTVLWVLIFVGQQILHPRQVRGRRTLFFVVVVRKEQNGAPEQHQSRHPVDSARSPQECEGEAHE